MILFGNIVLIGWPVVVFTLFKTCSRSTALLASIIAAYLLLPTGIANDLPGLPILDKDSIPAIAAFIAVLLTAPKPNDTQHPGWFIQSKLPLFLVGTLLLGAVLTVMTNGDALSYGPRIVPGLRSWDALSTILSTLTILLPFILGRKLLAYPYQQRRFLVALVVAGMGYSFLALYEVRMSPQLNNMVYGFFPHSWLQHVRANGFRPIVFLNHGLWVSIFFSATVLAAFSLMRMSEKKSKTFFLCAGIWLLITLIFTKSLGALIITLVLLPCVLLVAIQRQLIVAAVLASIVLIYPMLRGAEIIPVDKIMTWVESISAERAESFNFRLVNETLLLERAQERPLFGWGKWGRNFVIDDNGEDISFVADGYWVLVIGQGGWVKYLSEFGLLCLPAIVAFTRRKSYRLGLETSVLILILVGNLIDLLPNATITPLTWLLTGAIWGRLELGLIPETGTEPLQSSPVNTRHRAFNSKDLETPHVQPDVTPAVDQSRSLKYTRQAHRKERRKPDE